MKQQNQKGGGMAETLRKLFAAVKEKAAIPAEKGKAWFSKFDRKQQDRILIGTAAVLCLVIGLSIFALNRKEEEPEPEPVAEVVEEPVVEEEPEPEPEPVAQRNEIDFDRLHEVVNPDIYAWIYAPGSNINYPMLRSNSGQDTDYYLEHNYNYSAGLPGCIYTQLRNAPDFSDPDTVVYGHDMKNGSMFKSVHWYEDAQFFADHKYIYIYTPDEVLTYQTVATFPTDDKLILAYYDDFKDESVFADYLVRIREAGGNQDTSVELDSSDRLLTLSTCIATAPNMRYLLVAKLLDDDELREKDNEAERSIAAVEAANAQRTMTGDPAIAEETAAVEDDGAVSE